MDRVQLEAHPGFPFAGFRSDAGAFLLLELYWPAVLAPVLPAAMQAELVPLAEADQDTEGFGTPTLLSFWVPSLRRGLRVLYNDPPDAEDLAALPDQAEDDDGAPWFHSRLFAAAAVNERPADWPFPGGATNAEPVLAIEELVLIADVDPRVADAVQEAARRFLLDRVPLAEMQRWCAEVERRFALPAGTAG